jgi:hypothetical protein
MSMGASGGKVVDEASKQIAGRIEASNVRTARSGQTCARSKSQTHEFISTKNLKTSYPSSPTPTSIRSLSSAQSKLQQLGLIPGSSSKASGIGCGQRGKVD